MPYVDKEARKRLNTVNQVPKTSGELNYLITLKLVEYVKEKGTRYATFNDVVAALEEVKHRLTVRPTIGNRIFSPLAGEIEMICAKYEPKDRSMIYSDILGALECAKLEFVRRIVSPYEDKKIDKNGDVY